jgi:GTP-binding protein
MIDTGGIVFGSNLDPKKPAKFLGDLPSRSAHFLEEIRIQAQFAIDEADIVLFMVDATDGLTALDEQVAEMLRRARKPVLVVANKADNAGREMAAAEFARLGFSGYSAISSIHGHSVADLLDTVVKLLQDVPGQAVEQEEAGTACAIVGRPNTGKSSLLNALLGAQRAIVSPVAGTTRDALDVVVQRKSGRFKLIDTAGVRRRGKIAGSLEYYCVLRAMKAMNRSDVALVVIDAGAGLTDGDKRIAGLAHEAGAAQVLVVNKWDIIRHACDSKAEERRRRESFLETIQKQMPHLDYVPAHFCSAKEGFGLEELLALAKMVADNASQRIATGQLNRSIEEAVYHRPYQRQGKELKIYYATMARVRPPTIILSCNDPKLMHFSYQRYLLNRIRSEYGYTGAPVRIIARGKDRGERIDE